MITPEMFVGQPDFSKINQIVKIFDDAYKSELSLIILDDIERLIEFIHIGPRFSNALLQALMVLIKKKPPKANRKLMIVGTTSQKSILQEMDLVDCFNVCLNMPSIHEKEEVEAVLKNFSNDESNISSISDAVTAMHSLDGLTIKNFMLAIELSMTKSSDGKTVEYQSFLESLDAVQN